MTAMNCPHGVILIEGINWKTRRENIEIKRIEFEGCMEGIRIAISTTGRHLNPVTS
jgi:hypothetical protein